MTGLENVFSHANLTLQVCFLDLLLSVDNAVVIAMICRSLPQEKRRAGMLTGTCAAILIRSLLTTVAGFLMSVPMLKLAGGLALVVIAIRLIVAEEEDSNPHTACPHPSSTSLLSAIGTMIVADLVMSVDHVVGLAAITQGNTVALVLGLAMSVPLLVFGSTFASGVLRRYPVLMEAGGAMLAWIAGDIAITDKVYADWIGQQSPALMVLVPILTAVFAVVQARAIRQNWERASAIRPAPRHQPPKITAPPPPSRPRASLRAALAGTFWRIAANWFLASFAISASVLYFLQPQRKAFIAICLLGATAAILGSLAQCLLVKKKSRHRNS